MSDTIKIVLADDEALFRKGVAFILQRERNFEILFEASNGSELIDYLDENKGNLPDVILMDLKMPLISGVEATKIIHKVFPDIKIIALTSYNTKPFIANMIQVGASSYLVKNATPKEMLFTINEVISKGFYYNDFVMQVVNESMIESQKKAKSNFDDDYLTNREKEVLQLICGQLSTNEIAEKLFISPRTVEGHRNNLLLKTDSKNVAGLVVYAIQNRIISLDSLSLQ
ncbi:MULTISPECIES: response regulator transcription factor [Flavobacterium]|uniref:response regulator n=1 Tax=Flavobacterium TaxID=237 RepID=UPI00086B2AF7|nr:MULTISPECIES: response regulator transcription factor [Flavobacterium]MBN9286041.1 response regulator transcription factor [Flavobacterium sp.]ODS81581.1 MAG: DNA-binding response regulator [Chryseobacterium sp. SCN 40-13]OJV69094.1 MAG: DNA-binding response regulator [Flavobacterium sp. 40-81]